MADLQKAFSKLMEGFAGGMDRIAKFAQKMQDETDGEKNPQTLSAEKLRELRWMSPGQLAAIYRYGSVKTHIADDPEAYKQLRWLTEAQLQAIFGKDGMNQ